jgi:hypothetical protein
LLAPSISLALDCKIQKTYKENDEYIYEAECVNDKNYTVNRPINFIFKNFKGEVVRDFVFDFSKKKMRPRSKKIFKFHLDKPAIKIDTEVLGVTGGVSSLIVPDSVLSAFS